VTITVAPQVTGNISNFVSVGSDVLDPVPANNSASILVFVLPLPRLSISALPPSQVRLSWPVELTNFLLQYNASLINGLQWSNSLATPAISGSQRTITDTNSGPARFYRLKQ
jgi:hypothetical protein